MRTDSPPVGTGRMSPRRTPRRTPAIAVLLAFAIGLGCSAKVTNLDGTMNFPGLRPNEPYALRVRVEGAPGLVEYLRKKAIFQEVVTRSDPNPVDLVIKARSTGAFRTGGAANFFMYFPGSLLLVPSLRGIRWTFDANAEVEVTDTHSGTSLGTFKANTSHQLVHRASVPGSFFGAVVIIPMIVNGAKNAKVRPKYEQMVYAQAYDDLWNKIGGQLKQTESQLAKLSQDAIARQQYASAQSQQRMAAPPSPTAWQRAAAQQQSGPLTPGQFYSKRVAVVVGIDKYDSWPELGGAHNDARRMADHLRASGFDEVVELYDKQATRRGLLTVLGNELSSRVDQDSLAFIFFAGHGQTETLPGGAKRGYLVPVDADVDDVFSTAISMDTIRDLSNRMTAKHVVYAIDACYSGLALTRGIAMNQNTPGYLMKITSKPAVQIMTAGSEGEQAIEVGGQGVFTTYLLRALSGEADLDGDGAVTASEMGTWVKPQVSNASQARQNPQFGTIDGAGDAVFVIAP